MSQPRIAPYLMFQGNCEEAFAHYHTVLGGTLHMMKYRDAPEMPDAGEGCGPGAMKENFQDKVMHAGLQCGETLLMASDNCFDDEPISGVSISVEVDEEDECRRIFEALGEGGKVSMPLNPTFWSPLFGMFVDRFGVSWMVGVKGEQPEN